MKHDPQFGYVLIVSRDEESTSAIMKLLNGANYLTQVAATASEVFEACRDTWFHLVLIDLDAIGDTLVDLIQIIRIVHPDILIVAFGDHNDGAHAGVSYLDKPLDLSHFQTILCRAIEVREARNQGRFLRGIFLAIVLSSLLFFLLFWLWR